jgi:steroid 5-alpha reductase family enzyme
MKQRHFIDSHKLASGPAILGLMWHLDAWDNATAWTYLALHGTYGVLWALKSRAFPDRQWEQQTGLGYGLVIWAALSLWWLAPWLIASTGSEAPPATTAACVAAWGLGVFLHFSSDMQKHESLRLRPGELFTGGLWARCRNPNYLGELLIYGSFTALARHWIPVAVLATFLAAVWIPNMLRKDRSLARHAGFAEWKRRSGLLFPRPF